MATSSIITTYTTLNNDTLKRAYHLMCATREMNKLFAEKRADTQLYVHYTARGHEAVQIAAGMQLKPYDYVAPYYRDEAMLLATGLNPDALMKQLLGKGDDAFSAGRNPYGYSVGKREDIPIMPFVGRPDGSHVIPATGLAQGLAYLSAQNLRSDFDRPVVFCSLGDGALTNGEVAEALQMALLKRLPIIYLVQDNDWARSARAEEYRAMDPYEFAGGIKGLKRTRVNGADFVQAYESIHLAIEYVRIERLPIFLHAKCPLIGDFNSELRTDRYRPEDNLILHGKDDPIIRLQKYLIIEGETEESLAQLEREVKAWITDAWEQAVAAPEPSTDTLTLHTFASTEPNEETVPAGSITHSVSENPADENLFLSMAQAASQAVGEILATHPEALFYGEDVGGTLGGLFGEAQNLAPVYGEERVFNTAYQPAYLVGASLGLAATGCKPIVEVAAEELWQGLNQLVHGLSASYYLSNGQFPAQVLIRVPVGAYGYGPFQSGSLESVLLRIPGIKVAYPSTAADLQGILHSAFADPNPVVVLEHRGLYQKSFSVAATAAKTIPLGVARVVQEAAEEQQEEGTSLVVITYGMGVHWSTVASEQFPGSVEILDLRTLQPLDWPAIQAAVKRHNKALILTEEVAGYSFAEALAGRISRECFQVLDAPVLVCGTEAVPLIPQQAELANAALPSVQKVAQFIASLLQY